MWWVLRYGHTQQRHLTCSTKIAIVVPPAHIRSGGGIIFRVKSPGAVVLVQYTDLVAIEWVPMSPYLVLSCFCKLCEVATLILGKLLAFWETIIGMWGGRTKSGVA